MKSKSTVRQKCLENRNIAFNKKGNDCLKIKDINLIINLAAVHRMPGHNDFEYFETNIEGAKNICKFADKINCKNNMELKF